MTRLVLDTNSLRRGQFNVEAALQWVEAVGPDADIFVPEAVIWEWAEHAASAHKTLQSQLAEFRVEMRLYERPTLADQMSIESLVERVEELLPDPIRVWSPPSSTWKQAVMDQVLQVGSGERKEGVKTGAADSIVLACVQDQVYERHGSEAVLLATNDKGLSASCSRFFGEEVLVVRGTVDLLERLNAFEPAEQELLESTEEALRRLVTDPRSEIGAALQTFDMGFRIHISDAAAARTPGEVPFQDLARLGRVSIVELHDLRIADREDRRRFGLADVRLFADIHMTRLELRQSSGGTSDWVTTFDGTVTHGFVDLPLAVSWDHHWNVESVSSTGLGRVSELMR